MGLALDEPNENEDTTQVNGIDILIAGPVKAFTDGNTTDYMNSPDGQGFVITSAGYTPC